MFKTPAFILLHLLPLLLASTAFTFVTAPFGRSAVTWSYFAYAYHNGWGYVYHSDYTLAEVLAYLLAYISGMVLYPRLTHPHSLGLFAALICFVGAISFLIELSHWGLDHHLSLIGSFPIVLLPIAVWTILSLLFHRPRPTAA